MRGSHLQSCATEATCDPVFAGVLPHDAASTFNFPLRGNTGVTVGNRNQGRTEP
jgi:hypothetical protein